MMQKSITAFFKPKIETGAVENYGGVHRSPKSAAFKRRRIQSSSDEDEFNEKSVEISTTKGSSTKLCSHEKVENNGSADTSKESSAENMQEHVALNYNPAKVDYHPINDAFWKKNEHTPYLALTQTFQLIEDTRGRLKMIDVLSNFFSSVILLTPEDLLFCVYLSVNQLAPAYEALELGVAEHTLMKAICNATGREMQYIKTQTQIIGDLGIVAEQSRIAQRMMFQPTPLTVRRVFQTLKTIANSTGKSKMTKIQDIFVACRCSEARFFIRSLMGKLRIGIAEQSLMHSLAAAISKTESLNRDNAFERNIVCNKADEVSFKRNVDDASLILRTAYSQCPNFNKIIPVLLEHGIRELLERCPMSPGIPIKPMLAQPTNSIREVLERLEGLHITCEWKYDGERAQIHCDEKGVINIYSRNQENNNSKFPDIISRAAIFKKESVRSYILDSEIVAWDVECKKILPFQVLSTRKRKNVVLNDIKVQVCVYVFDLLYLNGAPLVTKPFAERRHLLKSNFLEVEGEWQFATACDTQDITEVQQCLENSIKGNCEGLMVKTLNKEATYEIAKRSRSWLKLKKDYLSNIGDSLDLVVIGGYKGKGKRTGTYGGFLLACYDNENEEYQSICKLGTGFSDEDLQIHYSFFKQHILNFPKSYFRFDNALKPDDWFEPIQVWEVKCADLSLSPVHKAAIGLIDSERGISLRFPRFIRIRDDKSPENATLAQEVAYMYSSQDQIKNQENIGVSNEFENHFY